MAFDLEKAGGFGTGKLGNVTNPGKSGGDINSYAAVFLNNASDLRSQFYTYQDPTCYHNGIYHDLTSESIVGTEVLLVATCIDVAGSNATNSLGFWTVCTITGFKVNDSPKQYIYTTAEPIDERLFNPVSSSNGVFAIQCVTIPHFATLTISADYYLKPPRAKAVDYTGYLRGERIGFGGILAFKCSNTLKLNGVLDTTACGFPLDTSTAVRPNMPHESYVLDTSLQAGNENSITKDRLLLNCGDGACFVVAKTIDTSGTARIGQQLLSGVQYCRGASDSEGLPSEATNVGGSTLLLVANSWTTFTPAVISKYRCTRAGLEQGTGRGLARAYIALGNLTAKHLPDEGLYALDVISSKTRLKTACNFSGFGSGINAGSIGSDRHPNSFATVSLVSSDGYTLTYSKRSVDVDTAVDFEAGNLIMIHQTHKTSSADINDGKFVFARITHKNGSTLTLNHKFTHPGSDYYVQLVAIPQVSSYSHTGTYTKTPEWYNGCGGIWAVMVKNTCDLSNCVIDLTGKGTGLKNTNKFLGNAAMSARLPIGQGNGSALIIAKTLKINASTRIGQPYTGNAYGGRTYTNYNGSYSAYGGYRGVDGKYGKDSDKVGYGGWGGAPGLSPLAGTEGGWYSNAVWADLEYQIGLQGAHVLIIADTIDGFNLAALATGGTGGGFDNGHASQTPSEAGGCGYGGSGQSMCIGAGVTASTFRTAGAGGFNGGGGGVDPGAKSVYNIGGGAGGNCFIYCNKFTNADFTNILTS